MAQELRQNEVVKHIVALGGIRYGRCAGQGTPNAHSVATEHVKMITDLERQIFYDVRKASDSDPEMRSTILGSYRKHLDEIEAMATKKYNEDRVARDRLIAPGRCAFDLPRERAARFLEVINTIKVMKEGLDIYARSVSPTTRSPVQTPSFADVDFKVYSNISKKNKTQMNAAINNVKKTLNAGGAVITLSKTDFARVADIRFLSKGEGFLSMETIAKPENRTWVILAILVAVILVWTYRNRMSA